MPDSNGKLSLAEIEAVAKWLREKWGPAKHCEMCGISNWAVGDFIVGAVPLANGNTFFLGQTGKHYPEVPIICMNCGNSKNINAIVCRLIEPTKG